MARDFRLKVEAFLWMWFFQGAFALFSFHRVSSWRERLARPRGAAPDDLREVVRRVRYAIRRANVRVWKARCLADAFTAQVLLARRGVTSDLRIGVRKDGDALDAHAWLELDGRCILGEGELQAFTKLQGLEGRS